MIAIVIALAGLCLAIVGSLVGAMLWMATLGRGIGRIETKLDTHGDHLETQSERIKEIAGHVDAVRFKVERIEGQHEGQHMATLSGGLKAVK